MRFDYSKWRGPKPQDLEFIQQLMEIYRNLLLQTGGDVDEALRWMEHFGEQYGFFNDEVRDRRLQEACSRRPARPSARRRASR